jgi:hypothetical protein
MRTIRFYLGLIIAFMAPLNSIDAASVRVESFNGVGTELLTIGGDPLPTGGEGPGTILILGYFTLGTPSTPFAGAWIPLTGPGLSPPMFIGSKGLSDFPGEVSPESLKF